MKKWSLSGICVLQLFACYSQTAANTWAVKFADAMIARYQPTINAMTSKGWEYSNTIILHGMEKVYEQTLDPDYLNYIKTYVDTYVNSSGTISATLNSLDRTHPGISCLFLHQKTGLAKYKTAATTLRNMYVGPGATYPKTAKGGIFWHKNNGSYDDIILIDGIYMLHPFLAKYGSLYNDNAAIDTAVNQTLYIYNQLYDNTTHLIKHAWNPTKTQTWANSTTGSSSVVWSRAMGWYMMALVDMLEYVPAAHARRSELITALSNLVTGIQTYQNAGSGLWYQVVDQTSASLSGNYLETSGSAMFVYAIKTAVENGWINASYLTVAQNGWTGLKTKISTYTDGMPAINDFAPAMSVQNNAAAYVQSAYQPVDAPMANVTQHPHGFAAILMAALVMEFPLLPLPVHFGAFTGIRVDNTVQLAWKNLDIETDVQYYIIQRSYNGIEYADVDTIPSNGTGRYRSTDHPAGSLICYRIRAVSFDGITWYSSVVTVPSKPVGSLLTVLTNPVSNGLVHIRLEQPVSDKYTVTITTSTGIPIARKVIDHPGEGTVQTISLSPSVHSGIYYLKLEAEEMIIIKSILVI